MLKELLSKKTETKRIIDKINSTPFPELIEEINKAKSTKKVLGGVKAKKNGENFENYFKRILDEISNEPNSPIVCYRKHSNEVVGALSHKKMFGLIKKLGYLKGDLDYSITLKSGYTMFVECKSGNAILSEEQEELVLTYIRKNIPFFIFCKKGISRYIQDCIITSNNFEVDKSKVLWKLNEERRF